MNESNRWRSANRSREAFVGFALAAGLALASPLSLGAVYKCEDASGAVVFTDQACPDKLTGTTVELPETNVDHGYDRSAPRKVRARENASNNKFRSRWQAHNSQMSRQADKPDKRRAKQYRQLQDRVLIPRSDLKDKNHYQVHRGS